MVKDTKWKFDVTNTQITPVLNTKLWIIDSSTMFLSTVGFIFFSILMDLANSLTYMKVVLDSTNLYLQEKQNKYKILLNSCCTAWHYWLQYRNQGSYRNLNELILINPLRHGITCHSSKWSFVYHSCKWRLLKQQPCCLMIDSVILN